MKAYYFLNNLEAGTDEAGRGCLAGAVTAAAVIFPKGYQNPNINDSKKLSHQQRRSLAEIIKKEALSFGVAFVSPETIDRLNILNASILAMHQSLSKLKPQPEFILVDGNRFKPYHEVQHLCVVKGDAKFLSIAAASILAKTYRDEYMEKLHEEFPQYNWAKNKGYPTEEHRAAIRKFGPTPYHRKSFTLLPPQLRFEF